jgi:RNA polymerase sigma factor (sigma-70 family)
MTFEQFLSPLIPLFLSATKSYGLSYSDSQDAIQEATVSLWKKFSAGKIDLNKNTKAYALQLIHWRAKDVCRFHQRRDSLFSTVEDENNLDSLPCPVKADSPPRNTEIWTFAKKTLKPREFEVFADYFFRGKTVDETAEQFGLDKQNIYLLRCRALKKVKKYTTWKPNTSK